VFLHNYSARAAELNLFTCISSALSRKNVSHDKCLEGMSPRWCVWGVDERRPFSKPVSEFDSSEISSINCGGITSDRTFSGGVFVSK